MGRPATLLYDVPIGRLCVLLMRHRAEFRSSRTPLQRERARRAGAAVRAELERRGLRVAAGRFTDAPEVS